MGLFMKGMFQRTIPVMFACCFLSNGYGASYWSVGTFSMNDNAERERDRIARETGLEPIFS